MSLSSSTISLSVKATVTLSQDLISLAGSLSESYSKALGSGTGADQADQIFVDTRTLSASATEDLDLAGGGLLQPDGTAFAPAKLKVMYFFAAAANTNNVRVARATANGVPFFAAANDEFVIKPGGVLLMSASVASGICSVTAATGDLITITNSGSGTSVTYNVILIGTSA